MTNYKEKYEQFDFYCTGMGFESGESCFLWRNSNEEILKLSDYGITEQDVYKYVQLIKLQRKEAEKRHQMYEHRSNFFKVLSVLFLIYMFFFIIGYFNDFMRKFGIVFDIICYPVYIGLVWFLYRYAYLYIVFVIEYVQEKIEEVYKYPNNGHPIGYNQRIEKYFNDLLWKLKVPKTR